MNIIVPKKQIEGMTVADVPERLQSFLVRSKYSHESQDYIITIDVDEISGDEIAQLVVAGVTELRSEVHCSRWQMLARLKQLGLYGTVISMIEQDAFLKDIFPALDKISRNSQAISTFADALNWTPEEVDQFFLECRQIQDL